MIDKYNGAFDEIYKYVSHIVDIAIEDKRKIILWGCSGVAEQGSFVKHIVEKIDGRRRIDYFIDNDPRNVKLVDMGKLYRESLIWYLDSSENLIICTVKEDNEILKECKTLGYAEGKSYFNIRNDIGGDYIEYLLRKNPKLDFENILDEDNLEIYGNDRNMHFSMIRGSGVDDILDEVDKLNLKQVNFFDFGCGKGNMVMFASLRGYNKVGGGEI